MAKQNTKLTKRTDSSLSVYEQTARDSDVTQTRRGHNPSVSQRQIDSEHYDLLALEIEFSAAVAGGASRGELFIRLTQLVEAVQSHFDSEEFLMRSSGFPGFEEHAKEHRKLVKQICGLRDGVGSGVICRCDALALFVRLWTEQHMEGMDAHYAQFREQRNGAHQAWFAWCSNLRRMMQLAK